MHQQTTVTWLKAASAIVIAFGLVGVLGAYPATSGFARIMGVPGMGTGLEVRVLYGASW